MTRWERPFRMIQANLRKIDAVGLDVAALLDGIREYGGDATLANAGGLVAWYPTELPYQRRNEHLDFDFVGRLLEEARRRDIRVLLRLDVSKQYDDMYGAHPEWFARDARGEPIRHWDMLATCWNGPYWQEKNFEILDEILGRYEPDGIFYNAYSYTACSCDRCRKSFRDFSGADLPTLSAREDWDDPVWRLYVQWRYRIVQELTRRLQEHIHRRRPSAALSVLCLLTYDIPERLSSGGWAGARMARLTDLLAPEAFDNLGRPLPKWIHLGGEEASIGSSCGKRLLISLTCSEIFASRRSAQPAPQLAYDIMDIAARGGNPNVALSGTFEQNDTKALGALKETFRFLEANRRCYDDLESTADAALFYSQTTMDFYGRGSARERALFDYRGLYEALVHTHRSFDVIADLQGLRPRHRALILPNVACLDADDICGIDRFVESGGTLIATGETSLYDGQGTWREGRYGLESLALDFRDRRSMVGSYLSIRDRAAFPSLAHTDLVALSDELIRFDVRDRTKVALEDLAATAAVTNNTPEFAYWTATTEDQGLVVLSHGRGKAAYLPWPIGRLYHTHGVPEYRWLIADLLRRLAGSPDIETDAPASVSISVARGAGGLLVHLLNATGLQSKPMTETIPVFDIALAIRCDEGAAHSLTTGRPLEAARDGALLRLRVPRVDVFEVIALER